MRCISYLTNPQTVGFYIKHIFNNQTYTSDLYLWILVKTLTEKTFISKFTTKSMGKKWKHMPSENNNIKQGLTLTLKNHNLDAAMRLNTDQISKIIPQ